MSKKKDDVSQMITLRVDPELHSALRHQAMLNRRSLNAEIVVRLEKSLLEGTPPSPLLSGLYAGLIKVDTILREHPEFESLRLKRLEEQTAVPPADDKARMTTDHEFVGSAPDDETAKWNASSGEPKTAKKKTDVKK
jgi:hypothetical protein